MNPRNIGALAGRVLLAVGIALGILFGTQAMASAADAPESAAVTESGAATQVDPEWG